MVYVKSVCFGMFIHEIHEYQQVFSVKVNWQPSMHKSYLFSKTMAHHGAPLKVTARIIAAAVH